MTSFYKQAWVIWGCVMVAVVGIILSIDSVIRHVATQTHAAHTPLFKASDCFVRNGIRETWEPQADGKVIMKGVLKYLLMDQSEADRKAGGTKHGYYETIDLFDSLHRKVLCPEKWITRK